MRRKREGENRRVRTVGSTDRLGRIGAMLVAGCVLASAACTDELPPPPSQPIAFSHRAHAEAEDIPCVRCHQGVATQVKAGLPPVSSCVSCHRRVIPDHPEIAKLMDAFQAREPIVWTKVNSMPVTAMVHFRHDAHIRAEIECSTCHGDVADMTIARRVINTADMGWCLDCHRAREASIDCLTCHH